ncbi:serpentine type 7TM GPCR chemoreceptor srt domain-containing protein [Ditylenchus destructor]|uniref:Serpentine type 7TM GPCR chemoreceptor srt domain-containing protein n=1 Tax=Ditylenchus destructor TaxID=166010 RepID=A0AAD4MQ08_9BILA|nr:serpentine type 7TM GPCR chemoreceptor srt domain-containing protein [Ditylenchus destructor]
MFLTSGLWIMESVSAMLLAVNRCIELAYPRWGALLYEGNRGWIWLIIPISYSSYIFIFTKPVLFNSLYFSWFFNPHMGYVNDFGTVYYNIHHTVHNITILSALIGLYLIFVIVILTKSSRLHGQTQDRSELSKRLLFQRKSFIQVFIICFINASAAAIYVYVQFFPAIDIIMIFGHMFWHLAHAIPSVIYWSLNKTIRNDCLEMIRNVKESISKRTSKIFPSLYGNRAVANSENPENVTQNQPQEDSDSGF